MLRRGQDDRTDGLALRYGLRFGAAAAPVGVGLGMVAGLRATQLCLPGCALFLAMLYLPGEAGHWTARRSGTIGSGTLAGTIAGGCVGLGLSVAFAATTFPARRLPAGSGPLGAVVAFAVGFVVVLALNAATFAGIGSAAGAIGATIGRDQFRRQARATEAQDAGGASPAPAGADRGEA